MTELVELVESNAGMAELLSRYADDRSARLAGAPNAGDEGSWGDRIMAFEGLQEADLTRLHGLLLASGLIETRVHAAAFDEPGTVRDCYRVTGEGLRCVDWLRSRGTL